MNISPQIKLSLDSKNKFEAIKELSMILKESGKINTLNNFINEINQRESILSTYCGYGVAIPHCESTEVLESGIAFGRSDGLIWDENDDSVSFVLLLAIPKNENKENSHIEIMSKIASLALDEKIRKKWKNSSSISEIENTFKINNE